MKITKPDLSFLKCMYYSGTWLDTKIKFIRWFLTQTLKTKFRQDVKNFGAGICKHHAKLRCSHNSVSEDSGLRGRDTMSGSKWFPMVWKIIVPSASRIKQGKKNSFSSQTAWPLKVKVAHSFEMWRTKHPMTQCDITADLKPLTHSHTHTHTHTHTNTSHNTHFGIKNVTCFSEVLLATPLHPLHVQAVQIIVPCVAAATAKHKNLQHTIFSVPATLSLLCPPVCHKQTHSNFK